MATNYELAQLAAYNSTTTALPSGWTLFRQSNPDPSGYQGYAYQDNITREIVIAHRGTEPPYSPGSSLDWSNNLQMAANQLPDQYQYARQFYIDVLNASGSTNIATTGHSLGGSLAQLLAADKGLQATTFNPYGAKDLIPAINARYGLSLDPNATYNNIVNHQTMLDGFSRLGSSSPVGSDQIGQMQTHLALSEFPAAAMIAFSARMGGVSIVAFPVAYLEVKFYWSHSIDRFTQEIFAPPTLTSPAAQNFVDFARALGDTINAIESGITSAADPIVTRLQNDFQQLTGTAAQTYQDAVNSASAAMEQIAGAMTAAERATINTFLDFAFGLGNTINGLEQTIADLINKFHTAQTIVSPIALDLNGDGITTTSVTAGTHFDHDGNGFAEQTGWVNAQDGILVRDLNGNGTIDTGRELFGSETLLANGQKAANGYAALAELDTNLDGQIDQQDAAYTTLKIWKDANGDGYSSADELYTLADAGVQSIATGYTAANQTDANGNTVKQTGTFTRADGSTGATADIWFKVDKTHTIATDWLPETAAVTALPDLQGFGNVYDLHQVMVRDSTGHLQSLVSQFSAESDPTARNALVTQIIYVWTGVENIDPANEAANDLAWGVAAYRAPSPFRFRRIAC